jgi:hypothetical protein
VERRLAGELTELVRDISIGFLAPIFFLTAGFSVTLDVFSNALTMLVVVTVLAIVTKIIGTSSFYLLTGNGWREGLVIGAGMNGRGAVEIILAQIALSRGIISQEIFSVLVFMAIFTTATDPLLMKWGADWLRRRGELMRSADKRTGVVIVGAGPLSRAIARELAPTRTVWLIDSNLDRCTAAKLEGLSVLYGDSLDHEDLAQLEIANTRWFLALTANTEINILAAQIARNVFNVPDVYVLLTRTEKGSLSSMLSDIGATGIGDEQFDCTGWDRRLVNSREFETIEMKVDVDIKASAFLKDLDGVGIPLVIVSENGQRVPFLVTEWVEAGATVVVLRAKFLEPQNVELVMAH